MEDSKHPRGVGIVSLALALVLGPMPPAGAEGEPEEPSRPTQADVRAGTDQNRGVVFYEAQDGVRLTPQGIRRGGGRRCRLEPQGNIGAGSASLWAEHPDESMFALYCNGQFQGFRWRRVTPPARGRPIGASEIARRIRDEIPMPGVELRANPAVGIAGLEAWFWAEGYSGDPIVETRDALGRTFRVVAAPARYHWDFGDGTVPVDSANLGQAYPQRSEVRHVYESMSAGYPVQVRFVFDVRYQVDGGEWIELPSIERTASTSYRVGEIRTVVTARR